MKLNLNLNLIKRKFSTKKEDNSLVINPSGFVDLQLKKIEKHLTAYPQKERRKKITEEFAKSQKIEELQRETTLLDLEETAAEKENKHYLQAILTPSSYDLKKEEKDSAFFTVKSILSFVSAAGDNTLKRLLDIEELRLSRGYKICNVKSPGKILKDYSSTFIFTYNGEKYTEAEKNKFTDSLSKSWFEATQENYPLLTLSGRMLTEEEKEKYASEAKEKGKKKGWEGHALDWKKMVQAVSSEDVAGILEDAEFNLQQTNTDKDFGFVFTAIPPLTDEEKKRAEKNRLYPIMKEAENVQMEKLKLELNIFGKENLSLLHGYLITFEDKEKPLKGLGGKSIESLKAHLGTINNVELSLRQVKRFYKTYQENKGYDEKISQAFFAKILVSAKKLIEVQVNKEGKEKFTSSLTTLEEELWQIFPSFRKHIAEGIKKIMEKITQENENGTENLIKEKEDEAL